MQAIILAAGMGKRLKELTDDNTKCMVRVNGVTMIERMLRQLDALKLSLIVMVVGYKARELIDFISRLGVLTPVIYVTNEIYDKTNNIYSLYLARDHLMKEDTLLLESDLIFEDAVLDRVVRDPYPSLALVAKYESWMDGTVVTIDDDNNIRSFLGKKQFKFEDIRSYYKTVNIYKFSREFSNSHYVPFLEAYSKALGNNEYYEQVLKVITLLEKPEIKASVLENEKWYEIDDIQDLDIAESIFTTSPEDKLRRFQNRYGGYWRYPHLVDFCYLVNPYYPSQKLLDEIKANFERLITEYPSGMAVNSLLAAKYFGLKQEHIVVGNGAAELIKSLMENVGGKIGCVMPTFEEYPNRVADENKVAYIPSNRDLAYNEVDLMEFFENKSISALVLIDPDNPSGNHIGVQGILKLAAWAESREIRLIVDESFADFSDTWDEPGILSEEILNRYRNLIVIKSISKSFGVPGLRLGILASGNKELISFIKKDVAIWNINSFAEFYLQIFEKYKPDYRAAMRDFCVVRKDFMDRLKGIPNLRVIPSQANFILCELAEGRSAEALAMSLLDKYELLIKDLSSKRGFDGEYFRVAVKRPEENDKLIRALMTELDDDKTREV